MTDLPAWVADYVGLPWEPYGRTRAGVDCWGLVRLVYEERLGIELPDYADHDPMARRRNAEAKAVEASRWIPVTLTEPMDVVVLRVGGYPCHVGLMVSPQRMLHIERGIDACIEDLAGPKWRSRIEGAYRWPIR